jgi:hypothetical protein
LVPNLRASLEPGYFNERIGRYDITVAYGGRMQTLEQEVVGGALAQFSELVHQRSADGADLLNGQATDDQVRHETVLLPDNTIVFYQESLSMLILQ